MARRIALTTAFALAATLPAAPAAAAPITITKTAAPVSDGVSLLNPKVLPGSVVEYTLTVANPALNPQTVANVTICDVLPATMAMVTADYAAGTGPVEFAQGVVGSGLAYSYGGLAAAADGLAFQGADDAAIVPVAGTDQRVRRVCVTLTGTRMASGGSFRLRYRARVR